MRPFAFFVGTNGSGTTLHRAIFDSHPDLSIPGEAQFVAKLAANRERYEADGFDTARLVKDLRKQDRFENWGLDPGDVENAMADSPVEDYPDAIRRVYRLFAEKRGKSRYGDKTQANIHHLPLLAGLFPEAKFIHAVRDGRDVALAHTDGTKIEQVAVSWKRRVTAGREAGQALGPDRYIESRFEQLIDDTETSVRRVCEFIDLPFDPQMLKYYERAGDIVWTTAVPERHKDIFLPPTKGLKDWRRDLSDDQVARFEALAGPLLTEMGYERKFEKVPLSARNAALRQVAADSARYAVRKVKKVVR
jgi:Sulfotransferase family